MTTEDKVVYAIAVLVVLAVLVIVLDVACMMALDMPLAEIPKRAVARVAGMEAFQPKPVAAQTLADAVPTPRPVEATPTPSPSEATPTPILPTPMPTQTPQPTAAALPTHTPATQRALYRVVEALAGDTIKVSRGGKTYLICYAGIDAPEPATMIGYLATQANQRFVKGKTVYLERDASETDQSGCLLRHVFQEDGTFVSAKLVYFGYAQVRTDSPDTLYWDLLLQVQQKAKEAKRGLWGSMPMSVAVAPMPVKATPTPGAVEVTPTAIPSTATQVPPMPTIVIQPTATPLPPAETLVPTTTPVPPTATPVPLTATPAKTQAQVVRVIDGDTIEVSIGGTLYTVRYIGIDTPETKHPEKPVEWMGQEAAAKNEELVGGKIVELEKDVSETDQYDRLLRYVWIGDLMVNAELVRLGYATVSTYPPDVKYQDLFVRLEREAREAGLGLWGPTPVPEPTPTPSAELGIVVVDASCCQFDAPGDDNENKEAEWVCFANVGGQPADMTGWMLHDDEGWRYTFPAFSLAPGQKVRVRTGCGADTATDLYWCKDGATAVWNNEGDTVFLLDAGGNPVAEFSY